MEKDRNARIIAIIALVIAVAGVSIGFAVLSTNLTIEPIDASVKANNDLFTVYFSSSPRDYQSGQVKPELTEPSDPSFTGNEITVEDKSTTLKGIGGTFTEPGQSITYHLGISNKSKLDAYLHTIKVENVESSSDYIVCTPVEDNGNPIDDNEMDEVCDDIDIKIQIGQESYYYNNQIVYNDGELDIHNNGHLYPGQTGSIDIIITYDDNATPATGDFKVTFGNIKFGFTTEDNSMDV